MALKTDYKDDIFSGNRKYAQVDNGDGTISFTDETTYDQVGDSFGATQINEIDSNINSLTTSVNDLNSELTAGGTKFYFDSQGGKWGWNSSPARGAGTFHPFRASHTQTYNINARGVADLGEFHEYRYINTQGISPITTVADRNYSATIEQYGSAEWRDNVASAGWTYLGSAIIRVTWDGWDWVRPMGWTIDYDGSGNIHITMGTIGAAYYRPTVSVTVRNFYCRVG